MRKNKKRLVKIRAMGKLILFSLLMALIFAGGIKAEQGGNIDWQQFKGTRLKGINISMVVTDYGYTPARLAQFEKLTGMKIDIELVSDPDRRKKLLLDFATGRGDYDVCSIGFCNREEFAQPGYLEPLEKYLNDPELTDKTWYNLEDYTKSILASGYSYKGDLVFIPYTAEYFLLWYRKDIFQNLGLSVPTSIPELRNIAEKLDQARKAGKITEYAWAERAMPGSSEGGWNLFCTANRMNVELVDFTTMISYLEAPQGVDVLDFYTSMIKKYAPPGSENWTWGDIGRAFKQGMLAMTTAGNASYRYIEDPETSKVAGNIGYAPPPMAPGGKDPLWVWGWGINYKSKFKKAAWLFIEWATSPDLIKEIAPDYGCPARKSAYFDPAYVKAMPSQEFIDAQLWMLEFGVDPNPPLIHARWAEAADIVSKEMNAIVAGIKTVEQAARDANRALMKVGYRPFKPYKP